MWTKSNPGAFDRYAAAEPDEPIFVLQGRDPLACLLVSIWVGAWQTFGGQPQTAILDAVNCSLAMETWARNHGYDVDRAVRAWLQVLRHVQLADLAAHGMPCVKCDDSGVWIRQGVPVNNEPCPVCARPGTDLATSVSAMPVAEESAMN